MPGLRPRLLRVASGRLLALALLAALIGLAVPCSALGWANNGDGYSTHDWFIDQAVAVLDGRADDWFDPRVARLASDDPDTTRGLNGPGDHVYRETGVRGAAVQRVSEHYSAALADYRAGVAARESGDDAAARASFADASREIGLLSHYYTDILQPYHSAYAGIDADGHLTYELLVDALTHHAADSPAWHSSSRTVTPITNIRSVVISAAAFSRAFFGDLYAEIVAHPSGLTTLARDITGKLARRGAQDLANIIYSVALGVGESPDVASLSARVKWTGVAANESAQAVFVTARDAAGQPIEGLEIIISWPLADGGTRSVRRWTDPSGAAKYVSSVGGGPLLTRRSIDVSSTATTPAATKTASTWFMVTPRLADGSTGFRTVVREGTLKAGETAVVTTVAQDTAGHRVTGLLVTWTWKIGTKTITTTGFTNEYGRARTTLLITSSMPTSLITVTAHTQAASHNRYSYASLRRI